MSQEERYQVKNYIKAIDKFQNIINYYNNKNKIYNYTAVKLLEKRIKEVYFIYLISDYESIKHLILLDNEQEQILNDLYISQCSELKKIKRYVSENLIDLSLLYQMLSSIEFTISQNNAINFSKSKIIRDKYGAYYTPKNVVENIIEKLKNEYISNQAHIYNLKIIDMSCGSGIFLTEYIKMILITFEPDVEEIEMMMSNIYGVDVDKIALYITGHEIFQLTNVKAKNLILANPLISNSNYNKNMAHELSLNDRLYNKEMGIFKEFFDLKFDIILGNPPWEKVRFEEKKFFSTISAEISKNQQKNIRLKAIDDLENNNPKLYNHYLKHKSDYLEFKKNIHSHPVLSSSLKGELNTYSMFTELAFRQLKTTGLAVIIVKSSLIKVRSNSELVGELFNNKLLKSIDIFSNKNKIFEIDSREEFCIVSLSSNNEYAMLRSGLTDIKDYKTSENYIPITYNDLLKINPETALIPNIKSTGDLLYLKEIYNKFPLFKDVFHDVKFGRIVHFTNHSDHIVNTYEKGYIPIYEGKFINQYNSRFATFLNMNAEDKYSGKASAKKITDNTVPVSRYFIEENFWNRISKSYKENEMIAWRSLTSVTNKRTMIATLLPFLPASQSIQLLQSSNKENLFIILALFNSYIFDYLIRLKMPGIDLTQSVIRNIPVPSLDSFDTLSKNGNGTIKSQIIDLVRNNLFHEDRLENYFRKNNLKHIDKIDIEYQIDLLITEAYDFTEQDLNYIKSKF